MLQGVVVNSQMIKICHFAKFIERLFWQSKSDITVFFGEFTNDDKNVPFFGHN